MLVRHRASIAKSLTLRANRTCPVGLACSVESGTGLRAGNGRVRLVSSRTCGVPYTLRASSFDQKRDATSIHTCWGRLIVSPSALL